MYRVFGFRVLPQHRVVWTRKPAGVELAYCFWLGDWRAQRGRLENGIGGEGRRKKEIKWMAFLADATRLVRLAVEKGLFSCLQEVMMQIIDQPTKDAIL